VHVSILVIHPIIYITRWLGADE